jgi:hypothetical protein
VGEPKGSVEPDRKPKGSMWPTTKPPEKPMAINTTASKPVRIIFSILFTDTSWDISRVEHIIAGLKDNEMVV